MPEFNAKLIKLSLCLQDYDEDREKSLRDLAKGLRELFDLTDEQKPADKEMSQVWNNQELGDSVLSVLRIQYGWMSGLGGLTEELIADLERGRSSCELVVTILRMFMQAHIEDTSISSAPLLLIKKLIFIFDKIASLPTLSLSKNDNSSSVYRASQKKDLDQFGQRNKRLTSVVGALDNNKTTEQKVDQAFKFLCAAEVAAESDMIKNIIEASRLIDDLHSFQQLVSKFIPKNSINRRNFLIALLAFQTKFEGIAGIRRLGLENLSFQVKRGADEALEFTEKQCLEIPEFKLDVLLLLIDHYISVFSKLEKLKKYFVFLLQYQPKNPEEIERIQDFLINVTSSPRSKFRQQSLKMLAGMCLQEDYYYQSRIMLIFAKVLPLENSQGYIGEINTEMERIWRNPYKDIYTKIIDIFTEKTSYWFLYQHELKVLVEDCRLHQVPRKRFLQQFVAKLTEEDFMKNSSGTLSIKIAFVFEKLALLSERQELTEQISGEGKGMELFVQGELPSVASVMEYVYSPKQELETLLQISLEYREPAKIEKILKMALNHRDGSKMGDWDILTFYLKRMHNQFSWQHYFILYTLLREPGSKFYFESRHNLVQPLFNYFFDKYNDEQISEVVKDYNAKTELKCLALILDAQCVFKKASKKWWNDENKKPVEEKLHQLFNYQALNENELRLVLDCLSYWVYRNKNSSFNLLLLLGMLDKVVANEDIIMLHFEHISGLFWSRKKYTWSTEEYDEEYKKNLSKLLFRLCEGSESLHQKIITKILQQGHSLSIVFNTQYIDYPFGLVYGIAFSSYLRGAEANLKLLAEKSEPVSCFLYGCYVRKMHITNPDAYNIEEARKNFDLAVKEEFPLAQVFICLDQNKREVFDKAWESSIKESFNTRITRFLEQKESFISKQDDLVRYMISGMSKLKGKADDKDEVLVTLIRSLLTFKGEIKDLNYQLQKIAYLIDKVLLTHSATLAVKEVSRKESSPVIRANFLSTEYEVPQNVNNAITFGNNNNET